MSENNKKSEIAAKNVFVVKMHKLLKAPHILGFKSLEEVEKMKKLQGARYSFFKVPVEKL